MYGGEVLMAARRIPNPQDEVRFLAPLPINEALMVELVYTTDLKSVAGYGMLVRVQLGAPN
tara:strand:+ start:108 stop:290 length:183 start_codon:yes stop_codon:yes gene_type:complete